MSRILIGFGSLHDRTRPQKAPGLGREARLPPGIVCVRTEREAFAIRVISSHGPPPADALVGLAQAAIVRLAGTPA